LREAADVYLGRKPIAVSRNTANPRNLFAHKSSLESQSTIGRGPDIRDGNPLFGGELPSNAEKHCHVSACDGTPTQDWSNFASAVVRSSYGTNAKVVKTMSTLNGFHTWEYGCKHKQTKSECLFQGRIFYPLPDDAEYVPNLEFCYCRKSQGPPFPSTEPT
jgi:hypothetical protein